MRKGTIQLDVWSGSLPFPFLKGLAEEGAKTRTRVWWLSEAAPRLTPKLYAAAAGEAGNPTALHTPG